VALLAVGTWLLDMLLAIGLLLVVTGAALFLNVGGSGDAVIRRVTSRSLGELAPGFAASREGFLVYSVLVIAVGVSVGGVGAMIQWPEALGVGISALGLGLLGFAVASVIAIAGEVRTYRALKR
jgi:hypothetical protein